MLSAVLFYAVIGWFGDSLNLLVQIAQSTNAQPGL